MTAGNARCLAERTHAGVNDRYGEPLLDHVRRVARAVPPEARAVAWLHETLECSPLCEAQLYDAGATGDEVQAVRLLTRETDYDVGAYRAHVTRIAQASGRAGELARIVKRADLQDRLDHQDAGGARRIARPPYLAALTILLTLAS